MKNQETPAKNPHAGHRKRLRERYGRSGMDDFADHEVMELLLTYAIPRIDVNEQAHALIDRFGREISIFKRDDGCFDLNVKVAISPVFLSWLLIFGNDLEVIAPTSVREELADLAKKVLEKYK